MMRFIMRKIRGVSREQAFTILEVITVVGLMAILAAIAVPNLMAARTHNLEREVGEQLRTVANHLNTHQGRGQHSLEYGLDDIGDKLQAATSRFSSMNTVEDTTFRMTRNAVGDYCLVATHTSGYRVLWDSTLNIRGDLSRTNTVNCSLDNSGEAYVLGYDKVLRKAEEATTSTVPCPVQTGEFTTSNRFYSEVATDQHSTAEIPVELRGKLSLEDDCQTIRYNLRVVNADPQRTYFVPFAAPKSAPNSFLNIRGTETVSGSVRMDAPITDARVEMQGISIEPYASNPVFWAKSESTVGGEN